VALTAALLAEILQPDGFFYFALDLDAEAPPGGSEREGGGSS
jgi:hypothetical protein